MESKTLSAPALKIIESYLHLPFKDKDISCPYFNNRRQKVRGALRVLIGKGSVEDIIEEAMIFGLKEKVDIKKLSNEELKKYLIDHNVGIDCSGLAYYILDGELKDQKKSGLKSILSFPYAQNFIRKLLIRLRPVENAGVRTFAHEKNTKVIPLHEVCPSDMIIMMGTGRDHDLNHMLIIHEVEYENGVPKLLHYTHSLAWSTDGKYNHGVRQGQIEIVDVKKPLLEQKWTEQNQIGEKNETYWRATTAEELSLKRLKNI